MWIFIWSLLSAFILGAFGWSMIILYQQKKTWKNFAKSTGLSYQSGGLTGSPSLTGQLNGYTVSFHTEVQDTPDARGQKFMTVMEFELGGGLPTGAALSSPEYGPFLATLNMNERISIEHENWEKDYVAVSRDASLAKTYLTPARLDTLSSIFKMKNSMSLFFFDELDAVLRIETSDPLRNSEHMKRIVKRLLLAAETLKATEEEAKMNEHRRAIAEERESERREEMERLAKERAEKQAAEKALRSQPVLNPLPDQE